MDKKTISVIEAAKELQVSKQQLFKVIKRLGIDTIKQRSSNHRNQLIAFIDDSHLDFIRNHLSSTSSKGDGNNDKAEWDVERGVFYLIQLEPECDPGRFKVGFASNLDERLRTHRCSAPFSVVVDTWPCHKLWEKTAIDSVTQNCEKLHTEVFRTNDLENVKVRCDKFFSLMPSVDPSND